VARYADGMRWTVLSVVLVACGPTSKVRVADGVYWVDEPDGPATDAIVHLHGHGGDAKATSADADWLDVVAQRGVVVAFPQGQDGTWKVSHHVEEIERDDRAFLAQVAADLVDRYGVERVTLSGSSEGAAMVYDMLCGGPAAFDAYAPTAGAFFDAIPEVCGSDGAPLRALHGTADTTWPIEGQDMGWGVQMSPIDTVEALRAQWGCDPEPTVVTDAVGTCDVWSCPTGPVSLCLHNGGHGLVDGAQAALVDWITSGAW
jgi:polyhydroxybutyrate depolymerase